MHVPVLLREVTTLLRPERGGVFVDATIGLGGHAEALLAAAPSVRVVGIDADPDALAEAATRLAPFGERLVLVAGRYEEIAAHLDRLGITTLNASDLLPNVPSLSSTAGLEGFDKTGIWWGVVVPTGTPDAVVQTLHRGFVKALSNPVIQAKLVAAGFDPAPPAPVSEFAKFVRDQVAFWADLVKASGASVD